MNVVGIIAEYNPFHKGHAYQIQKAKEQCGAEFAVVVMNGDFVQRGEPAIFDKYTRTKEALLAVPTSFLNCRFGSVYQAPVILPWRHSCAERSSICHAFMFWHGNR